MACNLITLSPKLTKIQPRNFKSQNKNLSKFNPSSMNNNKRGDLLLTKAGPPSSTTLILVFVFPFSLFAGTVFGAIRIADRLEEKFLEDLSMNKAIMEENEEVGDDEKGELAVFEEAAAAADAPRVRNRPRREVMDS